MVHVVKKIQSTELNLNEHFRDVVEQICIMDVQLMNLLQLVGVPNEVTGDAQRLCEWMLLTKDNVSWEKKVSIDAA